MSDLPSLEDPRPIPKEAVKFLKLSPSVKVMALKKSSTTCRVKASQNLLSNNPMAGGSCMLSPPESSNTSMRMKPIKKDRKSMLSVLAKKSSKDVKRQVSEKRMGDEMESRVNLENTEKSTTRVPPEEQKHWYTRWVDALISTVK